ncbi:hypothetical protein MMC18_002035, partial [Xylographa bjoerkii]|nr:hypothetical protein [Xylographa bjoerkii]
IQPFTKCFFKAVTGSVDDLMSSLQLAEQESLPLLQQPLATLAARKEHPEVLQLCFDRGAHLDANISCAAKLAVRNSTVDSIMSKHKLPEKFDG